MERREFIAATSAVILPGATGCLGGGSLGGPIESVEMEERMFVNLKEGHEVQQLELIHENGERIDSTNVGTETRVALTDIFDFSFNNALDTGIHEVVALNEDDNQIGSREIEYQPELQMSDFSLDLQSGHIIFTVENTGAGPLYLRRQLAGAPTHGKMEVEHPAYSAFTGESGTRVQDISYPGLVDGVASEETVPGGEVREYTTAEADLTGRGTTYRDSESGRYTPLRWSYSIDLSSDMELEEAPTNDDIEFSTVFRIVFSTLPKSISAAYDVEMAFSGMESEVTGTESRGSVERYFIESWAEEGEVVSLEKVGEGENWFSGLSG